MFEQKSTLLGDTFQPQLLHYKVLESDHFSLCYLQESAISVSSPLTIRDQLSGRTGCNKDGEMSDPLCPVNWPPLTKAADPEQGASAQIDKIFDDSEKGWLGALFSSASTKYSFSVHHAGVSLILVYVLEAKVLSEGTRAEQHQTSVISSKSVCHSQYFCMNRLITSPKYS